MTLEEVLRGVQNSHYSTSQNKFLVTDEVMQAVDGALQDLKRKASEELAETRTERDQLRAEVERLREAKEDAYEVGYQDGTEGNACDPTQMPESDIPSLRAQVSDLLSKAERDAGDIANLRARVEVLEEPLARAMAAMTEEFPRRCARCGGPPDAWDTNDGCYTCLTLGLVSAALTPESEGE